MISEMPGVKRVLDSNILIYSLIQTHPAYHDCARYLEKNDAIDAFSCLSDCVYEIFRALTIYYGIDGLNAMNHIQNLLESNISFHNLPLDKIESSLEPIKPDTRKKMELWEKNYLPPKGMPRILRHIYGYLEKQEKSIAAKFKKDTNNLLNLPPPC
jgi:hypothetical protein